MARAISRSQRARAAQRSRRRRSAALAVLLAASLGGAEIWSIGAANGTDMAEAAVTQAKSLSDLLAQRSPGERTEAQLTKTARAHALARLQRVVPGKQSHARAPVPPKIAMPDLALLLESPPPLATPAAATPAVFPPEALAAPGPTVAAIVAPPSGGTTPGGGSPPASFPTPQPKSPIIVPSAVPEPGTWATMLLGFALIGWRGRRKTPAKPLEA